MIEKVVNKRITSIDFLRGTVMIIMALDHVRDYLYSGSFIFDPLDFGKTTAIVFFTRWITNFCAPIFMMLAGTSAYLISQKKSKRELSFFLLKRGIWLIFLELVVVNFAWNFNINFPMMFFMTIWALGMSMIVLAGLIHLQTRIILAFCFLVIFGHDLLDNVHISGNNTGAFIWALLHDQRMYTAHGEIFLIGYPLLPLVGVMPLGYCLGLLYANNYQAKLRRTVLAALGWLSIVLFVCIRLLNVYGDPIKWTAQKNGYFTIMSFLNVNKYPTSLLYLLLTLGCGLLFLAYTETIQNRLVKIVSVYGRVPMFYYLVHIYIIHLIAMVASGLTPGESWLTWVLVKPIWFTRGLKGYGFSLPVAYGLWAAIVIGLYPLCRRYDLYKQSNKNKWWLSYL